MGHSDDDNAELLDFAQEGDELEHSDEYHGFEVLACPDGCETLLMSVVCVKVVVCTDQVDHLACRLDAYSRLLGVRLDAALRHEIYEKFNEEKEVY